MAYARLGNYGIHSYLSFGRARSVVYKNEATLIPDVEKINAAFHEIIRSKFNSLTEAFSPYIVELSAGR